MLPATDPGAAGARTPARSTRSTWSPPARTCSRRNDAGQELHAGAQPELGPGHRPEPQGAAGQDRGGAQRQRRGHRQPAAGRRPRHRRRPAPACRPPTQGKLLADAEPEEERRLGRSPRLWYISINPDVPPLDNIHCRKAVAVRGRPRGLPARATAARSAGTSRPACCRRRSRARRSSTRTTSRASPTATWTRPRQELTACGQPNGFSTNISYRAERPKEKATAESMQQALAKVGIKLTLKPLPAGRLLQALRRQAGLRQGQQPRPDGLRLGRRLAGRLRLPAADRGQPGHPGRRWQHQPGIKVPRRSTS